MVEFWVIENFGLDFLWYVLKFILKRGILSWNKIFMLYLASNLGFVFILSFMLLLFLCEFDIDVVCLFESFMDMVIFVFIRSLV